TFHEGRPVVSNHLGIEFARVRKEPQANNRFTEGRSHHPVESTTLVTSRRYDLPPSIRTIGALWRFDTHGAGELLRYAGDREVELSVVFEPKERRDETSSHGVLGRESGKQVALE